MKGHEVAADIFVPDLLNQLAQSFSFAKRMPTPSYFEDQAPHLVTFRVAAPHFAQLAIGWRLEGWKGLAKHWQAKRYCMDIQFIPTQGGGVNTKNWGLH
ncbi:hypothetical protein [Burkholderia anthina]|uniref:hypothetical protein n=1 Tax=Burkholderia anthina TaxID=179879 RepID=UPI001589C7DE|nr:hypothetical protein [Burkholderia anthina]